MKVFGLSEKGQYLAARGKQIDIRSRYVLVEHDPAVRYSSFAIAFALMRARKIVRGLKQDLTEDERPAVAEHVVRQLKERGDPWGLEQEAKTAWRHST
jgi:hypothetical protein